jgi:hypothetical protein
LRMAGERASRRRTNSLATMLHCKHPARLEFRVLLSGGVERLELVNA